MVWVYAVLLLLTGVFLFVTRTYGRRFFRTLNRREHRLLILYPSAGWILNRLRFFSAARARERMDRILKSLYVKENIEKERYLYQVRKGALMLGVWTGACILGFLLCLSSGGITYIRSLQRADYGQQTVSYEMEMEYRDEQQPVELSVEAVRYTESEIIDLFEASFEDVRRIVLADNESQDHVTKPLNLIREYAGFSIYWEIDDVGVMDYNGQIRPQLQEGETMVCSLFASFSLDDVTQIFTIPIRIEGSVLSEQEQLLQSIQKAVDQQNDIHQKQVDLPEEISGYPVTFFRKPEQNGSLFLFAGIIGIAAIFLLYDRKLQEKLEKRQDQMTADFAEIVSKLTLLYEAGLSIHGAFERIVKDYERRLRRNGKSADPGREEYHYAYREMKLALEKIRSGESEEDAYAGFGRRCAIHSYMKLGNLLKQNLNKGARGMQDLLMEEVEQAQELRKRIARKKGEEAGTKLLIPMVMMLLVVIAIIAVPALMSIGG